MFSVSRIAGICEKFGVSILPGDAQAHIPFLERYYADVFGITIDLSGVIFPENTKLRSYMAVDPRLDESDILEGIRDFFGLSKNLSDNYAYYNSVAEFIDHERDDRIQPRPDGLYVFAHSGEREPDARYRGASYYNAVNAGRMFATVKEYLHITGFYRYMQGHFVDIAGCTRTSSHWKDGTVVGCRWDKGNSEIRIGSCSAGGKNKKFGIREILVPV